MSLSEVFRIVYSDKPSAADFSSYAALQRSMPPGCDPCKWASCSLFPKRHQAQKFAKLPKIRANKPLIVTLSIKKGSGLSLLNKRRNHIDFWMFATFNPIEAIIESAEVS